LTFYNAHNLVLFDVATILMIDV